MERARIITLGNATMPTPTSFDEAFGEYSNLFGPKARARRQKRRMERINNRRERRSARQEMRLDKKRRRVEARVERRRMRSEGREDRRDRKSRGKLRRDREEVEQERELNPEEPEEGGGDYEEAPQGGYDDAPRGGYDEGGSDEGGYSEEGGSYEEESEEFDGDYDDFDGDEDLDGFDGEEDSDGFDGEFDNFDSAGEFDDFDGEEDVDGFDGVLVNGKMMPVANAQQVNQNVMDAAKRIEWNLELASRLKEKGNSPKVTDAVCQCQNRVAELESSMDGYCNFDGDFMSDADGKMKYMVRKGMNKLPMQVKRGRWKQLLAARLKARKERNAIRMKNGLKPIATPIATPTTLIATSTTPTATPTATPIATPTNSAALSVPMKAQLMQKRALYRKQIMSLKMRMAALRTQYLADASKKKTLPEKLAIKQQFGLKRNAIKSRMEALKKQYLEQVNAIKMSKGVSNATGIIGLDDAGDYDASGYEIKLGADGTKTSKIPFKAIAIGLVIGGLGVFLLKKYKVI